MDTAKLYDNVSNAFKRVHNVDMEISTNRARIEVIYDAIREDLHERMIDTGHSDAVPLDFSSDASIEEIFSTPAKAFDAALSAYQLNPYHTEEKEERFNSSSEYVAFDGYAHLVGLRDDFDCAMWLECEIEEYLRGNYGEPSEEALEALAEALEEFDGSEEA